MAKRGFKLSAWEWKTAHVYARKHVWHPKTKVAKALVAVAETMNQFQAGSPVGYRILLDLALPNERYRALLNEYKDQIYELRRRNEVRIQRNGKKIEIALTEQGYEKLERLMMGSNAAALSDGSLCVVVFDIPEAQRHLRSLFRRLLKESGFRRLQRSVWISDKDVTIPLRMWIRKKGLQEMISVFVAKTEL